GRHVRAVGAVALARVHDEDASGARGGDQAIDVRKDRAQGRRVVALAREVSVGREEINLEINDQERRRPGIEPAVVGKVERPRRDGGHDITTPDTPGSIRPRRPAAWSIPRRTPAGRTYPSVCDSSPGRTGENPRPSGRRFRRDRPRSMASHRGNGAATG